MGNRRIAAGALTPAVLALCLAAEAQVVKPPLGLPPLSWPLLRGLLRLGASLSPLFRRSGVTRPRERAFLALVVFAPLALVFAPHWLGLTQISRTGLTFKATASRSGAHNEHFHQRSESGDLDEPP